MFLRRVRRLFLTVSRYSGVSCFAMDGWRIGGVGSGARMARRLRVEYPGASFHLVNRGDSGFLGTLFYLILAYFTLF